MPAVLVTALLIAGATAHAQTTLATSFESSDFPIGSTTFTLGTPPLAADFLGGETVQFVGGVFYKTGVAGWEIEGPTAMGTITFDQPATAVQLFAVNGGDGQAAIEIRDTQGATLANATVTASNMAAPEAEFNFTFPDIGAVTVTNPSVVEGTARTFVDDFSGTLTTPDPIALQVRLDGDQVLDPVDTPATGSGSVTYDPATRMLSWEISFSDLVGLLVAAHFHGPAGPCAEAGVAVTIPIGNNPLVGSAQLTTGQAEDLLAGRWYVNLHSTDFPDGEIRGQVMPVPLTDPIPDPIAAGDLRVRLLPVAQGLVAPNWGTAAPGRPGLLYVADQAGTLWEVDLATGAKRTFLDVADRLVALGRLGPGTFDERGLLGVAFHPDFATNGLLYTYTSELADAPPDFTSLSAGQLANHQTVITEWQVPAPAAPDATVDPSSARELLRIDQPQFNHNAGALTFGPDGMLYIALGDGGGADDRDGQPFIDGIPLSGHGCLGNGADGTTILGSLLRVDPLGSNSANGAYGIPGDNPFLGAPEHDEIYAFGFRNPFRFSFDQQDGTLYLADVGQNDVEELNIVNAGGNYGWRWKEGTFFFVWNSNQSGYVTDQPLAVPAGLIDPIAQYDQDDGVSIIGGFVHRGPAPDLHGHYLFGEFTSRLFHLAAGNTIRELRLNGLDEVPVSVLGFGQDSAGEVYLLGNTTGTPFGDTGAVFRIASALGDLNCDGDLDFFDIDPFVLALLDPDGYAAAHPACDRSLADMNQDGAVDFFDIDPLVSQLVGN
jgi:glucose/arabinose dehydrogenase